MEQWGKEGLKRELQQPAENRARKMSQKIDTNKQQELIIEPIRHDKIQQFCFEQLQVYKLY